MLTAKRRLCSKCGTACCCVEHRREHEFKAHGITKNTYMRTMQSINFGIQKQFHIPTPNARFEKRMLADKKIPLNKLDKNRKESRENKENESLDEKSTPKTSSQELKKRTEPSSDGTASVKVFSRKRKLDDPLFVVSRYDKEILDGKPRKILIPRYRFKRNEKSATARVEDKKDSTEGTMYQSVLHNEGGVKSKEPGQETIIEDGSMVFQTPESSSTPLNGGRKRKAEEASPQEFHTCLEHQSGIIHKVTGAVLSAINYLPAFPGWRGKGDGNESTPLDFSPPGTKKVCTSANTPVYPTHSIQYLNIRGRKALPSFHYRPNSFLYNSRTILSRKGF